MTLHRLFTCISCRAPGEHREPRDRRSGARLHAALVSATARWGSNNRLVVAPVECLSACPQPCAIALRCPGKYAYVFGHLDPIRHVDAILACSDLYLRAANGFMPREVRPEPLRASILTRIPPING